jgi:F0F1-type ATP synthase membrane subunit c/vacuolar-type H+-ATPase subunit K
VRALVGLWRWRHNPLCRKTDLAEAWVAFAAVLLMAVAAPLAGFAIGSLSRDALLQSVREQHKVRHEIAATVVRKVSSPPVDPDPETSSARDRHSRVLADWTAPDGTTHSGTVVAGLRSPDPGDRFPLWTDEHGQVVGRPLDDVTASTHAALAGFGTAVAVIGLVEGTRRLIVWRIVARRYDRWDQAWDSAGPDWGRTGTGS